MPMNQEKKSKSKHIEDDRLQKANRKPYHKPKLEKLGDLRSLTLGPSTGAPIDSGGGWPADTWHL